jgi:L-ascorbate oxidase
LVNGKGMPAGGSTGSCELAAIDIEPDKTYRLRFIGGTATSFVWLGIDSHEMSIIEADGHYTQPVESDFLQIGSGQRYSVLLKAKTKEELQEADTQHFYMQLSTLEDPNDLTTFAVLQYPSDTLADLTTFPSTPPFPRAKTTYGWLDYQLRPVDPDPDFPTLDEVTRRIIITTHQNSSEHIVWLQSGYDWVETFPKSPYFVDIYQGKLDLDAVYDRAIASGHGFDNITRTFPAEMYEVLEIIWQNEGSVSDGSVQTHPFHGHGRHYYDIGGGDGLYDVTENEKRLKDTEPVARDTTMLYSYRSNTDPLAPSGWRGWRLRVTNAGVWMMHCHVLQHMIMGMQTVFIFGNEEDIVDQSGTVSDGYLTYGGDAVGNRNRDPVVQHFFD